MNDHDPNNGQLQVLEENQTSYYVKSTVLEGAIVVELDQSGADKAVSVHAGGERIAKAVNGNVTFEHHNPATPSWVVTNGHADSRMAGREERDPANAELPLTTPNRSPNSYVGHNWGEQLFIEGGDPWDYVSGVTLDGMPMTRSDYNRLIGRAGGMVFADFVGYHVDWRDGSRLGLTLSYLGSAVLSPLPQGRSGRRSGGGNHPQNPSRVTLPSRDALKQRLTGGCNTYIAQLIAKASEMFGKQGNVAVAKDGLDLLSKINSIVLEDSLRVAGYGARGTVRGSILGNAWNAAGTATIVVDSKFVFPNDPDGTEYRARYWTEEYIDTIIHEMIHLVGRYAGYDDRQLAEAAHALPGANPNLPAAPKDVNDALGYQYNSGYWDGELMKYCRGRNK